MDKEQTLGLRAEGVVGSEGPMLSKNCNISGFLFNCTSQAEGEATIHRCPATREAVPIHSDEESYPIFTVGQGVPGREPTSNEGMNKMPKFRTGSNKLPGAPLNHTLSKGARRGHGRLNN